MSGDKKDKGAISPSGILTIIKETYLHPLEETVFSAETGKVLERNGSKKKNE